MTGFDWFLNTLTGEERSPAGASLRSTEGLFDSAGRAAGFSVTSNVAGDVPVPDSTFLYARNTGLPLSTTAGGETVSTGFDSWAQPVSYTDAAGNASSTTYDLAGRASTHSDGKGTYSYTYDTAGEHRGLVTSMTVGVGGGLPDGFTVAYDAGGNPVNVAYPNGVTATMGYDTVGLSTGRQYTDHAGVDMLGWVLSRDGWGRVVEQVGPSATGLRVSGFGYDPAGRLTGVVDRSGAVCSGRGYGFDTGFNRLTRTVTSAAAVSGVCPVGSTVSTTTGVFNTASQLLSTTVTGAGAATGSYVYDGLGRTTTVPATDTNNPTGENLTLGFFSTDKPATQTLGGTVQSFGLDPVGRTDTTTTTTTSGSTTTASFFDSGSDSPAWSQTGGSWTRFVHGPDGALALQITGTGTGPTSAELMLVNPHGDITATIPNTTDVAAAQVSGINDTDEYGNVQTPPGPTPYGWEGAAQRSTADQAGIIQMGARQYNPTSGRFLTLDPIPGGNPNPYTYPPDPINNEDLDGEYSAPEWLACAVIGPGSCYSARTISNYVRNNRKMGRKGNYYDAKRHFIWNFMLMAQIGRAKTAVWVEAHEADARPTVDWARDKLNNALVQRTQWWNAMSIAQWDKSRLNVLFGIAAGHFHQAWSGRQSRRSFTCVYGKRFDSCRWPNAER